LSHALNLQRGSNVDQRFYKGPLNRQIRFNLPLIVVLRRLLTPQDGMSAMTKDSPSGKGRVLVTGGAGYIGSHTLLKLLEARHEVTVFDNFANSSPIALDRVRRLSNQDFAQVEGDIRDRALLDRVMADFRPQTVLHFAGLKSIGESEEVPLDYYEQNVFGSINLLKAMERADCNRIVFSSSATVYGEAQYLPFDENHPLAPTNAYGRSKLFVEGIIRDWVRTKQQAGAVMLRYFNPVGAHPSGLIGEDPNNIANNLMPLVCQVAVGSRDRLEVYGDDYGTRDGTGERDYIHVEDLAEAHLAATDYCGQRAGCEVINVGTGKGVTVLELVKAFEAASGRKIPFEIASRRTGDVASMVGDPAKAERLMGWHAKYDLGQMCQSAWHWQRGNPNGYAEEKA